MLVLTRKHGQKLELTGGITITVVRVGPNYVKLGIEAPGQHVRRTELPKQTPLIAAGK